MKILFAVVAILWSILLCGCTAETSLPESPVQSEISEHPASSEAPDISEAEVSAAETAKLPENPSVLTADTVRLSHTVEGVYSEGKYYTVTVSGKKCSAKTDKSICADGTYYDDLRMELFLDGALLDGLAIDVLSDNRFLIMESAADGRTYGCTLISFKRGFSAEEYPDIIQLDFYDADNIEVPQYGRFFTVFDGKLIELPVYENGKPAEPRGTHFRMKSAGVITHCLCVSTAPHRYTVRKYEYSFDPAERRLNKKEVKFYGWTVENQNANNAV